MVKILVSGGCSIVADSGSYRLKPTCSQCLLVMIRVPSREAHHRDYRKHRRSRAIATDKGSGKKFFEAIAQQLDIPTEVTDDNGKTKALTMEGLKEEIAQNVNEDTLLIFPEAKRLTTGIRYWLEDLIDSGVKVVCLAAANPGRDIFLEMLEIELDLPSDRAIRQVMEGKAVVTVDRDCPRAI